ncbi:hypothetical protein D3C81_1819700 [compost metagenome]
MASECDDDHVVPARGRQRSEDGLRHLCMCGGLIDKQSASQAFDGVGEQRPQRRRIAAGPAQLGDCRVEVFVDAHENCFDRHAAPYPIRAKSCSITSLASR